MCKVREIFSAAAVTSERVTLAEMKSGKKYKPIIDNFAIEQC